MLLEYKKCIVFEALWSDETVLDIFTVCTIIFFSISFQWITERHFVLIIKVIHAWQQHATNPRLLYLIISSKKQRKILFFWRKVCFVQIISRFNILMIEFHDSNWVTTQQKKSISYSNHSLNPLKWEAIHPSQHEFFFIYFLFSSKVTKKSPTVNRDAAWGRKYHSVKYQAEILKCNNINKKKILNQSRTKKIELIVLLYVFSRRKPTMNSILSFLFVIFLLLLQQLLEITSF